MGGLDPVCDKNIANIQSNLFNMGLLSELSDYMPIYWSSTEDSFEPQHYAWAQLFLGEGLSSQVVDFKVGQFGVRCVRAFTY